MSAENTSTEVTETESGSTTTTTDTTATETEQVTEPVAKTEATTTETKLPDDHPLVKTLATQKEELKQLRPAGAKVAELETKITELTAQAETATAIQAKYDRLESFLSAVGGPLSKALDSKSFTTALFESDTDVAELVTKWHKDNPSATSAALNSGAGSSSSKVDINALLRQAAK